ncbi:MAG: TIGR02281 family clan AA aspartic protease [Vampirovibrionales bacterium]|nr:TIGR02281 family clan AA aspartic protease [Vampirovibrionales bacterium]
MLHFFNKKMPTMDAPYSKKLTSCLLISALWMSVCLPASTAPFPPQTTVALGGQHSSATALLVTNSSPSASAAQAASFQNAYRQGVLAYRHGDYTTALNHFYQAEALEPDHVNTQYYLALVLDTLAKPNEAQKYYGLVSTYGAEAPILLYSRQRLKELSETATIATSTPSKNMSISNAMAMPVTSLLTNPSTSHTLNTTVNQITQHLQSGLQSLASPNSEASKAVEDPGIVIPLMNQTNALMVSAKLNDRATGTFVVDTGATYTSISQELADSMGPGLRYVGTVRITTANGQIDVPKVVIDRIRINNLEARNVEATVINLHKGGSFSGLLGLSFLRNFQLTINPKSNQLVFRAI